MDERDELEELFGSPGIALSDERMRKLDEARLLRHLEKGREKWALSRLKRMGTFDRDIAGKCLSEALFHCSAELFAKVLEHAPRGEYTGCWGGYPGRRLLTDWPEGNPDLCVGTLTAIAAALGKAEHLRLLLDWGCDVNGASLDAATALINSHYYHGIEDEYRQYFRGFPTAHNKSAAEWQADGFRGQLFNLTPLAAAAVFGQVSCVKLLLERKGVWLTETPSVTEALALRGPFWDTGAHRECRRLIRTGPDGSVRPLALWAAIPHLDAETLREELERCEYSREELKRAALYLIDCHLMPDTGWGQRTKEERWEMLSLLGSRCPEALRDGRVQRRLGRMLFVKAIDGDDRPLPAAIEQALDETVDLDESTAGSGNFSVPLLDQYFQRMGKNRRFVMSRDNIWAAGKIPAGYLRVLLRYVEFRPPSVPVGVSSLTAAILQSGDIRLIRQALSQGLIPAEEPLDELLDIAGKNTAVRALLLTVRRKPLGFGPPGGEDFSWRMMSEEDVERLGSDPALRTMASDALLFQLIVRDENDLLEGPLVRLGGLETNDVLAACTLRGERDVVLRGAAAGATAERPRTVKARLADAPGCCMEASLLCCAASAGQTACVRALLDAGLDPEERDMGQPSTLYTEGFGYERLSLSPLLGALLLGHWDTAALLLERGARCGLSSYTVWRAFWAAGREVPYEDIRRELGAYLKGERLERAD